MTSNVKPTRSSVLFSQFSRDPIIQQKFLHPEVQSLINEVGLREVSISSREGLKSEARFSDRTITISDRVLRVEPNEAFAMFVFELLNLRSIPEFQSLKKNIHLLTIDQFVEKWEEIEYNNAAFVQNLLAKIGVKSLFQFLQKDFRIHYLFQQLSGHTKRIERDYAALTGVNSVYFGTWGKGASGLSEEEKRLLKDYLTLLNDYPLKKRLVVWEQLGQLSRESPVYRTVYEKLLSTQDVLDVFKEAKKIKAKKIKATNTQSFLSILLMRIFGSNDNIRPSDQAANIERSSTPPA